MNFESEELKWNPGTKIVFKGYINESATLPLIKGEGPYILDLDEVTGLNSLGTRTWCQWITMLSNRGEVKIIKTPAIFIKCFNNVSGSLPANCKVQSFYVPFISPSDNERKDVLVTREQVTPDGQLLMPPPKSATGEELEMDVMDSYFQFLSA